jgi:hypothetical protein
MQQFEARGEPLPRQVHYYSNVGDRLPVLGDEERETRQTFQELVQLGHTCVVMLRRAIWSVDPTVFQPQYELQVSWCMWVCVCMPSRLFCVLQGEFWTVHVLVGFNCRSAMSCICQLVEHDAFA